jgi:hypothetical protein
MSAPAVGGTRSFLFFSGHAHRALDPDSNKASGGAELQVALLAGELARCGHRVGIVAAADGFRDGIVWQGVKICAGGRFDTGGLADTVRAISPVTNILREEKPEFVVVYGWTTWLALLCVLGRLLGFRVVYVCALDSEIDGGFRRSSPLRGRIFDWGLKTADERFAITENQAAMFHKKGMTCHVMRLLLQDPRPPASRPKSVDLLWVARCHPVKAPHLFLDLVEKMPGVKARMICSPQDQKLFEDVRARAAGIPGLEFVEGVPYREIQSHFDAARVFVNSSSDEGVPNTFLHSGLGGTAIISLVCNPDGMIAKFGAGTCAGGDLTIFQNAAAGLLKNPAALASAAAGARSFVVAWHDNTKNVSAFMKGLPS